MENGLGLVPLRTLIGRAWWLPVLFLLATTAAVKAEDYTYVTNSDNTLTITRYTGPGGAVVIPSAIDGKTVTSIGAGAFSGSVFNPNTNLTNVAIPDSVTSIGAFAFAYCTGLTSVTIGNSVASIGGGAFYRCTRLTSVTIPASVTNINIEGMAFGSGASAFDFCTSLTLITVDAGNSVYSSADGVLFNKSQTTLIKYPEGKAGNYTIPDSVTNIGNSAFAFCTGLTSVTIDKSVTIIGDWMFNHCIKLTSVTIPDSVTSIGVYAFWFCTALTSVTIPNGVASIAEGMFESCAALTSVTIPNGITNIGDRAFFGTSLPSATIPNSVVPWIPLVTANGIMGNVNLNSVDPVTIAIQTMNIGRYLGAPVDWWVIARAGSDWYYLNSSGQLTQFDGNLSHCNPVYQGPLFYLPTTEVLTVPGLPPGSYTFWFAVDSPMDGILNLGGQILIHSVNVVVQ